MDHLVYYYAMTRPLGWWGPVRREAERRGLVRATRPAAAPQDGAAGARDARGEEGADAGSAFGAGDGVAGPRPDRGLHAHRSSAHDADSRLHGDPYRSSADHPEAGSRGEERDDEAALSTPARGEAT